MEWANTTRAWSVDYRLEPDDEGETRIRRYECVPGGPATVSTLTSQFPAVDVPLLTSTAELRGTTVVEVVADTRFTNPENGAGAGTWEVAVASWRVDGAAG